MIYPVYLDFLVDILYRGGCLTVMYCRSNLLRVFWWMLWCNCSNFYLITIEVVIVWGMSSCSVVNGRGHPHLGIESCRSVDGQDCWGGSGKCRILKCLGKPRDILVTAEKQTLSHICANAGFAVLPSDKANVVVISLLSPAYSYKRLFFWRILSVGHLIVWLNVY